MTADTQTAIVTATFAPIGPEHNRGNIPLSAHREIRPDPQFSNLGDTGYQEISGVAMPARMVIAGMDLVLGGNK